LIRLTVLGSAALTGPDGPVRGRAAQRRRLAFLAILAAQRGGVVSRDRIVGLLWPEHDDDRARRLLSEALYVVRKELGEAVVHTPGDDLRLDPSALPSDLDDFVSALDRGDLETAVEVYGGPFLDGFYVDDASEFENWADGERAELARAYGAALRALARSSEEAGDAPRAAEWWRRLAAHDHFDASVALGLMGALEAAGKRAEAIRHAQIHAALLREELDAEPDPEVAAFAERLRDDPRPVGLSLSPAEARPAEAPAPGEASPTPVRSSASTGGDGGRRRRHHIPAFAAAAVLLALAALALWWRAGSDRLRRAGAAGPGVALVIPPFRVPGDPEDAAFLAQGVPTLLAPALDGAGGLSVVDPRAVLSLAGRRPDLTPADLAARFGAPARIEGSVVATEGRLRIEVRLVDESARGTGASASGEAPSDSLFALVDGIATQLLAARGADPLSGVAARSTSSLLAFRAFQEGAEAFRATRYGDATEAFQRAVDDDPAYALAHYRLSAASQWAFDFQRARVAIRAAQRHAERLPARERGLVDAWAAFLEGDADRAERAYEALVALAPHDPEAWAGLGEVLVHYNPLRGRPANEAREPLRRAVAIDPGVGEARFHLLEFAAADGDRAGFDSLYALVDSTSDQAVAWRAVRAAAWGDEAERGRVREILGSSDPITYGVALGRLAANLGDLEAAAGLGALADPPLDTPELAAAGRVLRAAIDAARGRPAAARAHLDAAAAAEPDWTREFAALFALLPEAPADTARLEYLRGDLESWDPGARSPNIGFFLGAHADAHRHLRLYLLGLLSVRLGDAPAAGGYARALDGLGRSDEAAALGRALAESVRAHAAAAAGDRAAAARHLGGPLPRTPTERVMISPFFARSPDRWLRARIALEEGDSEEALRWLRSLTDGYEFLYAAPAHLLIAQTLEAEGNRAAAADHYRRFVSLWSDAEPALQPTVAAARRRLARLVDDAP
jgi:DNA-binding SARP family transcriptional activator/TolB-like protein